MSPAPPTSPLFPYTTLFRSQYIPVTNEAIAVRYRDRGRAIARINDPASIAAHASGSDDGVRAIVAARGVGGNAGRIDRKSTRLNSSHVSISYAVFCLKKKTN